MGHVIPTAGAEVFHISSPTGNIDVSFKVALDTNGILTFSQFANKGSEVKTMADIILKQIFEMKPAAKTDLSGYVKTVTYTAEQKVQDDRIKQNEDDIANDKAIINETIDDTDITATETIIGG